MLHENCQLAIELGSLQRPPLRSRRLNATEDHAGRETTFRFQQTRCGVALVETIGVMAIVASILSLSAVILQQAFKTHQHSLTHFRHTEQLQRVADRLRRDVHAATLINVDEPGKLTITQGNGIQVIFRQQGATLSREAIVGEDERQTSDWRLPEDVTFHWTLEGPASQTLLLTRVVDVKSPEMAIEWLACACGVVGNE